MHEQIDAAASARALHDGLVALPDALRDVVELVVVDEMPLTEVAEVPRDGTSETDDFRVRVDVGVTTDSVTPCALVPVHD